MMFLLTSKFLPENRWSPKTGVKALKPYPCVDTPLLTEVQNIHLKLTNIFINRLNKI